MAPRSGSATVETARLSASMRVVRALEEDILQGRLKPGLRLDEQELARRFAVSRTPVREALRHLDSAGLIELRRNLGAVVRALTIRELIEMFQVMAELEGLCARLAARRMSGAERLAMRRAHTLCTARFAAGDHEGFFAANNVLHDAIAEGAHNGFLRDEARGLRNRVNPYRRLITFQPRRMADSVDEHQAVVEAIESGDGETAHRLMRAHVNLLGESAADMVSALDAMAI
jgi:DNA-binding GntR family transcriptional regulator